MVSQFGLGFFCYIRFFKGIFDILKAYLVVFGLFLTKTEKNENTYSKLLEELFYNVHFTKVVNSNSIAQIDLQ